MRILKLNILDAQTKLDLDAIEVGRHTDCTSVRIDGSEFLKVSKSFKIAVPDSSPITSTEEWLVAPLPLKRRADGLVVCFRAIVGQDGSLFLLDMGFTFDGDVIELGRFFLWDPESGRIEVSEELAVA